MTTPTTPHSPQPVNRPLAAAAWMTGSITGFSLIAISGRQLSHHLDTFEMMMYRSAIGWLAVLTVATLQGRLRDISSRCLGRQALRNIVHFAGQNLWLFALGLIPLAQLFALEFSSPILVALAAPFLLGERLTPSRLATTIIGFIGILVVARPFGAGLVGAGLIAAFGAAVAFAATAILTKQLTRSVNVLTILFWLTLMQTAFGLVAAGWDGHIAVPDQSHIVWVVIMGLAGISAHLGLTAALALAPASIVTPMDFLRLPVIGIVGAAFYHEVLDPYVLVGGVIIFCANWINIRSRLR